MFRTVPSMCDVIAVRTKQTNGFRKRTQRTTQIYLYLYFAITVFENHYWRYDNTVNCGSMFIKLQGPLTMCSTYTQEHTPQSHNIFAIYLYINTLYLYILCSGYGMHACINIDIDIKTRVHRLQWRGPFHTYIIHISMGNGMCSYDFWLDVLK